MVRNLSGNIRNVPSRNAFDLSTPEAVEKLIRMARVEDPKSISPLIEVLSGNEYKDKHRRIVEVLGNFRNEKVIELLISLLGHKDEVIRRYSAMSLGKLKSKEAVTPLARLLKDPSIPLKKTILEAIHKITASQEIHFLSHFLTKPEEEYEDKFTVNKCYYFDTVEDLIINFLEGKELLKSYIHLVILYEAEYRYVQAEEYMKKILIIRKDDIDLQLLYLKILRGLEKYSEMVDILEKILIVRNNLDNTIMYADTLAKLGRYEESISLYDDIYIERQSEEIEDKLREVYYYYGKSLEEKELFEEAFEQYEKAYLLNPSFKEADFFQSLVLFKSNKITESLKLLHKYIGENTDGKWYEEASELLRLLNSAPGEKGLVTWMKGFLR